MIENDETVTVLTIHHEKRPATVMTMTSNLVDLHQKRIYPARVSIEGGRITRIEETGRLGSTR
ncbi:MAG: hypothetical protein DYG98_01275 [Haliscomenobacteraceae bacterium CHB4]|nr:hypothetical protein [Saprospiraceae bacterium]MCE7921667.1 hypothetical protein [Haliscomenobacteraceae bacterium CHB4]